LGHARVRIEGTADPDCVRAALESKRFVDTVLTQTI
jgi:hypothetical protein